MAAQPGSSVFAPMAVPLVPAPTPQSAVARPPVAGWSSMGRITDERLSEISGAVVSRAHPGTLWVHNDSGDGPRVFAIGTDGAVRAEVWVDGAEAVDWEDIAFGPGPPGSSGDWVYVADTGNNFLRRDALSIYRFSEPSSLGDRRVSAERLDVRFDDGHRHNIEAMFVDPRSGDSMLVTKTLRSHAQLFRIPARPFDGSTVVAEQVGLLDLGPKVTGADISRDGSRIVIRTRGAAVMWERGAGDTIASAVRRAPIRAEAPDAEAIAFSSNGSSWFSISEGVGSSVDTRPVPGTAVKQDR
jgi:hypothetical protein